MKKLSNTYMNTINEYRINDAINSNWSNKGWE
jgi:hypothetical protein